MKSSNFRRQLKATLRVSPDNSLPAPPRILPFRPREPRGTLRGDTHSTHWDIPTRTRDLACFAQFLEERCVARLGDLRLALVDHLVQQNGASRRSVTRDVYALLPPARDTGDGR